MQLLQLGMEMKRIQSEFIDSRSILVALAAAWELGVETACL